MEFNEWYDDFVADTKCKPELTDAWAAGYNAATEKSADALKPSHNTASTPVEPIRFNCPPIGSEEWDMLQSQQ